MDNKHFPPLEPDSSLPETLPEIPERMEPLEDLPVIEDLSFDRTVPEAPAESQEPVEAADGEHIVEDPIIEEDLPEEAAEEEPVTEEPVVEDFAAEEPVVEDFAVEEPIFEEVLFTNELSTEEAASDEIPMEQPPIPEEPSVQILEVPAEEQAAPPADMPPYEEAPQPEWDPVIVQEEISLPPSTPVVDEPQDQEFREDDQTFDAMMDAPTPPPERTAPVPSAATQKGRPKRKKGEGLLGIPSILVTFVWLALIVIIGVTAGRMLWICAADVLAFGREDKVVTVTVYEADTMEDIINKLHAGGLIRYKSLFQLYADISDAEEDIKPGIYDLNTRYDYHALVNFMSPRSSREVIKLTIPEGYTCRQIFSLLEENRICTAVDAAAYAANGELSEYWFLEDVARGSENCLEGYLFPDTYEFYKNSTPREAIERMLDNFAHRFNEEMVAQLESLNKNVTDGSYGIREIVIIASLIEKESAAPGESPMVSGVIYNRLFDWGSNPPYLNIDASIVYAQDGNNDKIDTSLDSPYNTYLYEGLTPGPIANPGLSSLKAALSPESHNYYYYVLNPSTGMHQFSTTYQEHTGYVREFAASTPEIEIE